MDNETSAEVKTTLPEGEKYLKEGMDAHEYFQTGEVNQTSASQEASSKAKVTTPKSRSWILNTTSLEKYKESYTKILLILNENPLTSVYTDKLAHKLGYTNTDNSTLREILKRMTKMCLIEKTSVARKLEYKIATRGMLFLRTGKLNQHKKHEAPKKVASKSLFVVSPDNPTLEKVRQLIKQNPNIRQSEMVNILNISQGYISQLCSVLGYRPNGAGKPPKKKPTLLDLIKNPSLDKRFSKEAMPIGRPHATPIVNSTLSDKVRALLKGNRRLRIWQIAQILDVPYSKIAIVFEMFNKDKYLVQKQQAKAIEQKIEEKLVPTTTNNYVVKVVKCYCKACGSALHPDGSPITPIE